MSILKQEEIFGYLGQLLRRVKKLEDIHRNDNRTEELGEAEDFQSNAAAENRHQFEIVQVTTVASDRTTFACVPVRPDISTPWIADPSFTAVITVTLPTGVVAPSPGQITAVFFSGTFQDTTVASPVVHARYGYLDIGGRAPHLVLSEGDESLTCRFVDRTSPSSPVYGAVDVTVAKPFELRKSTYDGKTLAGVTYAYVSSNERTATSAATPSIQETQIIIPTYISSHTIVLVGRPSSGTGVANAEFEDMNQAGRAWAQEA